MTSALDIVRNFDEAVVHAGDIDLAMTYAHPDFTVREAPGLPYQKVYTGRQGLVDLMTDVGSHWEFLEPLTMQFFAAGEDDDLVVSRVTSRARVRATGEEVAFLVTEWITVRDGKVSDVEPFYWDQAPLLAGTGAVPARQGELAQ
jgi:uncharacterized protein